MAKSLQSRDWHYIMIQSPDGDSIFKILWTLHDFYDRINVGLKPRLPITSHAFKPKCNGNLAAFVNCVEEETYFQLNLLLRPKYSSLDFDYSIQLSFLDNQDMAADNIKPCQFLKPVILTTKIINCNKEVISVLNEVIQLSTPNEEYRYPLSGNTWGQFSYAEYLESPNDCLMIEFSLKDFLRRNPENIDMTEDRRRQLHTHFNHSYLNEILIAPDVFLRTEVGDIFCHKDILAAVSPTFKNIFTFPELKGIQIKVSGETANYFLRYIYTGDVPKGIHLSSIVDLHLAAKTYQVKSLMYLCENEVYNQLRIETAVDVFRFANHMKDEEKKIMTVKFIINHFEEVKDTQAYRNIPQLLGIEFNRLYLKLIGELV